MKIEVRVYKKYDMDILALYSAGYSIARMMRDAICAYAKGQPFFLAIGEIMPFDIGDKNSVHIRLCVPDTELEAIDLLSSVKDGYKGNFSKQLLRNALIPIVTVIAPLIVDLLTGALVVEKIYGINGIGKLMVDAITGEGIDYNYVLALGILYSAMYIGIMLVLDIVYCLLDPRIRVAGEGKKKKEEKTPMLDGGEAVQI